MKGLYLITNDDPLALLLKKLDVALATQKVVFLQYRRKKVEKADQDAEIQQILVLCEQYHVPFVINDDIAQAEKFAVHLHLGQSDGSIVEARQRLGKHAIIGRSCENSLDYAKKAIVEGADYIAFGAIYSTETKPEAGDNGLDVLKEARQKWKLPICAIGGLHVENSQVVVDAGADMCAVISDILALDIDQIAERIHAWAALFD